MNFVSRLCVFSYKNLGPLVPGLESFYFEARGQFLVKVDEK